jgi:hypothetical protein
MRYIILRGGLLLGLAVAPSVAAAQDDAPPADTDRWQIQTETGDYIWDIRLLKLSGDTLLFKQADTVGRARIDQIRELRLIRKVVVRSGAGEGGMAAAALTGSGDEIFDLGPLDFAARLRAIQQVFLVHPPSP